MITQQQQQKILGEMLKRPQNALCADCNSQSPCWASLDFGVFVCLNCSGAHRALGQSVTRIKSTKLDTWNKDWLWHMQLNNKMINSYYEASKSALMNRKPHPGSSLVEIKKFVFDKYVKKMFAQQGEDDPITNLKNGKPPIKGIESQPQNDKTETIVKQQKIPPKSVNQVIVKQVNKNVSLLEDDSLISNGGPSIKNEKARAEINLFQQPADSLNLMSIDPQPNRSHYSSSSVSKNTHAASQNTPDFSTLFPSHSHSAQKPKNISFDTIAQHSPYPTAPGVPPHHHYAQVPHYHHYPHVQHPQHTHHYYNTVAPTTNINIYSGAPVSGYGASVGNFTLSEPQKSNSSGTQINLSLNIKLDLNDFKAPAEPVKKEEKVSSWVDDWK